MADEAYPIGPRARRARATCASIASSTSPSEAAPTPFTRATASSRRTPTSPKRARARASPSSAPALRDARHGQQAGGARARWPRRACPIVPGGPAGFVDEARAHRQAHRLPGHAQGRGRRRRQRHAPGRARGRPRRRLGKRAPASRAKAFGDDTVYLEKAHRPPAPRRDPGARRRAWKRRAPLRARLLDPAPPPEGRRGDAVPRGHRRARRAHGRGRGPGRQGGRLRLAPGRSSSCCRATGASTSSR